MGSRTTKNRPPKWTVGGERRGRRSLRDDDDDRATVSGRGVRAHGANSLAGRPARVKRSRAVRPGRGGPQVTATLRAHGGDPPLTAGAPAPPGRARVALGRAAARDLGVDRAGPRARRHPRERRLRRGQERAGPQRGPGPPARGDAARGRRGRRARPATSCAPGTIVEIQMEGDDETTDYLVGSIEERHDDLRGAVRVVAARPGADGHGPGDTVSYEGPRRKHVRSRS